MHVIDVLPVDQSQPLDNVAIILQETAAFGGMQDKRMLLLLNKIDLITPQQLAQLQQQLQQHYPALQQFAISSLSGAGVAALLAELLQHLRKLRLSEENDR